MPADLPNLAKELISGEWTYYSKENFIKKQLADEKKFHELNLIDSEGYLSSELKDTICEIIPSEILSSIEGPFGDDDIFSGDVTEDGLIYNIELHNVSEETIDALAKLPGVSINLA